MDTLRRTAGTVALAATALLAVATAGAQAPVVLKLGTLAPTRSVWHNEIARMGSDWKKLSGGRVGLTIFAEGTQGDEDAIIRRMRINQLQAASLTAIGLARIDEAFNAFSVPLFYESPDELFHVMDRLTPVFEKRLEAKGYVLLGWGYGGWVQVFSREPIASLDDLRRLRIFTSAGDSRMIQWYKDHGFNPAALATTDMLTALQTGQVEAVPSTPLAVLTLQWYTRAPHMLDLGLAPLAGAQIMTTRAWQALPGDAHALLLEAARAAGTRLRVKVPESDRQAIAEMEKRGLTVSRLRGTRQAAPFEELARQYAGVMRGKWVPPDIFDLVLKERDGFRVSGAGEK